MVTSYGNLHSYAEINAMAREFRDLGISGLVEDFAKEVGMIDEKNLTAFLTGKCNELFDESVWIMPEPDQSSDLVHDSKCTNDTVIYLTAQHKLDAELQKLKGGTREKEISQYVAETLKGFCTQAPAFANVVLHTKCTLSDCCAAILRGCKGFISDIEVYRRAVQFYFPDSDVHFSMDIVLGTAPSSQEMMRQVDTRQTTDKDRTAAPAPVPNQSEKIQLTLWG